VAPGGGAQEECREETLLSSPQSWEDEELELLRPWDMTQETLHSPPEGQSFCLAEDDVPDQAWDIEAEFSEEAFPESVWVQYSVPGHPHRLWWHNTATKAFFLEGQSADWTRYICPASRRIFWWSSDLDWFFADTGRRC
jgi:hypothetical protein